MTVLDKIIPWDIFRHLGISDDQMFSNSVAIESAKEREVFIIETQREFDEFTCMKLKVFFVNPPFGIVRIFKYESVLHYHSNQSPSRMQTFFVDEHGCMTFKEAFNLLQGRPVYRDFIDFSGRHCGEWVQLNFEKKDENGNHMFFRYGASYGYELEKVLEKYPIQEMNNPDSRRFLVESMKRGNLTLVKFLKRTKIESMLIEPNLMFKMIRIYPITGKVARVGWGDC